MDGSLHPLANPELEAELVSRAQGLIPTLRERQPETEAAGRVPDDVWQQMVDAELFKVLLPKRYGGFEMGMDTFVKVGIEIGRGCGSIGWVQSVAGQYHLFLGMFEGDAQDEVWGEDPDAVVAASFTPTGSVTPAEVDGQRGWRLNGSWAYCSGIDNCPWNIVGVNTMPEGAGPDSEPVGKGYALARTTDFEVLDDWKVIGLAGTGSETAVAEDLFIPAHRFLPLEDTMTGEPPGLAVNPGPLYRIPLFAAISASLCAPILGMAQGALDEFIENTKARRTRGAALSKPAPMASLPGVQVKIGEAAASIDSARLLLIRDCADIMATVGAGKALTQEQRARNKGDWGFAARMATHAVDLIFQANGGAGLQETARMQRYWRDIHAGALHISMNFDAVGALYGRILLGEEPGPAQF